MTDKLKTALSKLKVQLQNGAIHGVINVFKEIGHGQALKQLEKAARAPPGCLTIQTKTNVLFDMSVYH